MDRPFDEALWEKAAEITGQYRITIEENKQLGFMGSSIEMPTVFADGKTIEECYQTIHEALTVAAGTLLEMGKRVPQPASLKMRDAQVNVRLTAEEKVMLVREARGAGFKGLSDYLRFVALTRVKAG